MMKTKFMYQNLLIFKFVPIVLVMLAITSCNRNKPPTWPATTVVPSTASPSSATPSLKTTPLGGKPSTTPSLVPPSIVAVPSVAGQPAEYQVIDEFKKNQFKVHSQKVLSPSRLPAAQVSFDAQKLLTVLNNTKAYFARNIDRDPDLARNGILANQGVSVANTIDTLNFMAQVLREDLAAQRPLRLQNSDFIQKNFRVIKWNAANPQEPDRQQIRMTKYAVFTHAGSRTKTPLYDTALYQIKDNQLDLDYRKYTKQQVLDGIYESGGTQPGAAAPLAYLTRDAVEDALLEGTTIIKFTDGSQEIFNVDRSNEIPYIKGLDRHQQKRYWYFQAVQNIKGYGYSGAAKIPIEPGVTFAGDILNIGLGKIVVVEDFQGKTKQLRLGVIADTGGAFLPNLHQLDFLAGVFESPQKFKEYSKQLPEYTNAYFLVKK
jgi:membrane-bound lytic murein transglycosylase